MISLGEMAHRKRRPEGPVDHIDESDRQAILTRMDEKGITQARIAIECDVTPSAVSLLLKHPIPKGKVRGCKWLAKLQTTLGLAVTARRPAVVPSERLRRAEIILRALGDDKEAIDHWLETGEILANRKPS
jgi:hypothetical protein